MILVMILLSKRYSDIINSTILTSNVPFQVEMTYTVFKHDLFYKLTKRDNKLYYITFFFVS